MIRRIVGWWVLVVMVAVTLGACATMRDQTTVSSASPSLYKRLGGREGIALVVDAFWNNLVADPRTSARFKAVPAANVGRVKSNMADQICDATGGPCSYLGKDMKTVHAGMKVTDAEWNATVENLVKALDAQKVGEKEKQELLALLGPMKNDIVGQ